MSSCDLVRKNVPREIRRKFAVEFRFLYDDESQIKSVIKFLRTVRGFEKLDGCYSWAEELADIIENK